jgi:deoxyribodipyrimidine photo-lyase
LSASSGTTVPSSRIRRLNERVVDRSGQYVIYWMTSARRLGWNFGLQRAVDHAVALKKPLVILEAVRCDYPGANDRLHQFILDGMAVNRRLAERTRALYYPYVEPSRGHGSRLLQTLAAGACVVVTDWYPAFFLPRMARAAAAKLTVALEAVDSNGLVALADQGKPFAAARFYRAFVQRVLLDHVTHVPEEAPLARLGKAPRLAEVPRAIAERWPAATAQQLEAGVSALAALPIDHTIPPAPVRGGSDTAGGTLRAFVETKLQKYADERNHPDADATSRLSPYLHFGHISAHEVFSTVMTHERWTSRRLGKTRGGGREGWWGVSPPAEAFLDQLVVWRELAFNGCEYVADYAEYVSLPEWARNTLAKHQADRRPHRYTLEQLESAETADPVWNAAQRQLVAEGWFHGYLRMLWGKKILEWSAAPAQALERMQSLMDRYSLDGRDANSYAGCAWVLGRYDRPWPERPIFGTVRYMTSESAKRKLDMKRFLDRYGDGERSLFSPRTTRITRKGV